MRIQWMALSLIVAQMTFACPLGTTGLKPDELKELRKAKSSSSKNRRKISSAEKFQTLPTAESDQPWGGKNSKNWKPEAILANATSAGLNQAWELPDVSEVLVSVPVKMLFAGNDFRVYGDGQTNASLSFGPGWNEDHPQLVATLIQFKNGKRLVRFRFSPKLQISSPKIQLVRFVQNSDGRSIRKDETLKLNSNGNAKTAEWEVPADTVFGDMKSNHLVWVRPDGWDSSFPIDFRMVVTSNANLLASAKSAKTDGKTPLDPLGIFKQSQKDRQNAQVTLLNSSFSSAWLKNESGGNELKNKSIHGDFPENGQKRPTAVGGGLTWLVDKGANSTFKNLYTCFEPRNFQMESQFGVPSGGGWHEIGDAAETIINDLETAAVPVGFATGLPWATPPDQTKFPWGLSDVATIRLLMPGEAVVTMAGDQTWKEDEDVRRRPANQGPNEADKDPRRGSENSGGGRNYHWFFFPSNEPTCTQEWVHNCRPQENPDLGLSCL